MCINTTRQLVLVAVAALSLAGSAGAACYTIDFEELAVGTAVTTQYAGVTFSFQVAGCPAGSVRIANPPGGTSSGTRALAVVDGPSPCEFNPGWLRMVFTALQQEVTFTLGPSCATYHVRAYSAAGALLQTQTITIPDCTQWHGVYRAVRVSRGTADIRRIEVEHTNNLGEAIDDLSFDIDPTAPIAEITSPAQLSCVCNGTTIFGSAYDPDGPILNWRLERKVLGDTNWILIRDSTSEVINGALATWNTSAGDGYCTLRLRVTNACETVTTWTTDIWLDRALNTLQLRSPTNGMIVGGTLCADGTAWDHCGGSFNLLHRPTGIGAGAPFDLIYPPWIINDPLGTWNTRGTPDGNYDVQLQAADDCDNSAASPWVPVVVDNTPPIAVITSPGQCTAVSGIVQVRGTAADANLGSWVLYYTGGDAHGWVRIANGRESVIDGVLANWDTRGLRACAYTLRLVVTDRAILDCNGSLHNQAEYTVSVDTGVHGDFDYDGDGDVDADDFGVFQRCISGPAILADPECRGL